MNKQHKEHEIKAKNVVENIRKLNNYVDTIIENVPGSVYCKDLNGVYLDCNKEVVRKGNFNKKEDVIGKTDYDLWPEIAESIRQNDLEVIRSNKTIEVEEKIVLPSGEILYFASVKTPLLNDKGELVGIVGNSVDVTELKMAKDKAEAANYAKSQFLAMVSHELRIPLTGIISTASMLSDGSLTLDEARMFGKIMLESGGYLLSHINNILDFSRLEAGKYEFHASPIDLKQHLEESVQMLTPAAKNKGLEIFVIYEPDVPPIVLSDARALRQIFNNLLSNSIKFTEKGHISIKVRCLKKSDKSAQLMISVKDTGIGIEKDKFDVIFEKFFQIEDAYVRKYSLNGTGLGLSIVKKLALLMNADIRLESEKGKGSTFSLIVDFPLQDELANGLSNGSSESNTSTPGVKALMVEDNLIVQRVHKIMLDKLGCQVDVSDNGEKALAMATNQHYNIIFVDIGLPDISGYEVIKQMRHHQLTVGVKVPIIALTAYTREEEKSACLNAGADEVACKPIVSSTLEEILKRYS